MNNQEICGTCWHYCPTGESCKHGLCCWRPEESVPDWFDVDEQNNGRSYDSPACVCYEPKDGEMVEGWLEETIEDAKTVLLNNGYIVTKAAQEVVEKLTPLITEPTHITYRNSEGNIYLEIPVELINGSGTNS